MHSFDLFVEVQRGDVAKVTEMLNADPQMVHSRGTSGSTLIHTAAQDGHVEMVLLLHSRGCAGLSEPNCLGEYPIHIAARAGHVRLLEVLYSMKDENVETQLDLSQYHETLRNTIRSISKLTYEQLGCAPNQTALHSAALATQQNSIVTIHRLGSEAHFQEDDTGDNLRSFDEFALFFSYAF